MALDAGMAQRRPKKKDPLEDELRVPPMPKTNETTATQTKKLADITPPQTNTRALERSSEKTPRSTQTSSYYADMGRGFSGGGGSFSDSAPKPPESELRIPPTPQTKATAEITAKPKTYDWENSTLERSSERVSRAAQRSDYSVDSDRGFTGGGGRLPDLSLAPDDTLAKTKRPEAYTEGNVLQYLDRAAALASLPEWTEDQRKEATEIHDLLKPKGLANGGTLSGVWNDTMYSFTKDSDRYSPSLGYRLQTGELQDEWQPTYAQLAYKTHPQESGFAVGLSKGTGATSISNAIYDGLEKSGVDVSEQRQAMKMFDDVEQYAKKNAPIAYAAGEITGNVALTSGLSAGIASLGVPPVATKALTFMAADAIHNVGDLTSGKMTGKEYLLSMGKSGASSLAGSLAGNLVNLGVADALRKHDLMTPFGEFTRIVASSAAQAGAYTAVDTAMSKEKPGTQEQAVTYISVFAFSALGQAVESLKTTASQRTQMQQSVSALQTEYDRLQANWSTMTPWERERAAEDIKLTTSNLQRELANGYFGGQQTAVNQARGTLEMINTLTDDLVRGLPEGTAKPDDALMQTITDGLTAGLENAGDVGYTENEVTTSRNAYEYTGTPEHITDVAATLPPMYEDLLSNGWEDISVPGEAASGHYRLIEPKTGLRIRFDRKVEGAPGFHGKDHYHILNPNATGNSDYYLDRNGNVLRKTDTRSHILPKEN